MLRKSDDMTLEQALDRVAQLERALDSIHEAVVGTPSPLVRDKAFPGDIATLDVAATLDGILAVVPSPVWTIDSALRWLNTSIVEALTPYAVPPVPGNPHVT
jgi:hypothetical protein